MRVKYAFSNTDPQMLWRGGCRFRGHGQQFCTKIRRAFESAFEKAHARYA